MQTEDFTIELKTLAPCGAKLVLQAAEREAIARGLAASIAVVDAAGNLLSFQRVGQASATSIEAAMRKARTAVHLRAPTKVFEDLLHGGMTSLLAFEFLTPSRGGVPILSDGVVVGAIGTSGGTGEEDELISSAGATACQGDTDGE